MNHDTLGVLVQYQLQKEKESAEIGGSSTTCETSAARMTLEKVDQLAMILLSPSISENAMIWSSSYLTEYHSLPMMNFGRSIYEVESVSRLQVWTIPVCTLTRRRPPATRTHDFAEGIWSAWMHAVCTQSIFFLETDHSNSAMFWTTNLMPYHLKSISKLTKKSTIFNYSSLKPHQIAGCGIRPSWRGDYQYTTSPVLSFSDTADQSRWKF